MVHLGKKGGLDVNSDTERISNFLEVTGQLIWAELSLHHPGSLRPGTTQDFKGSSRGLEVQMMSM